MLKLLFKYGTACGSQLFQFLSKVVACVQGLIANIRVLACDTCGAAQGAVHYRAVCRDCSGTCSGRGFHLS